MVNGATAMSDPEKLPERPPEFEATPEVVEGLLRDRGLDLNLEIIRTRIREEDDLEQLATEMADEMWGRYKRDEINFKESFPNYPWDRQDTERFRQELVSILVGKMKKQAEHLRAQLEEERVKRRKFEDINADHEKKSVWQKSCDVLVGTGKFLWKNKWKIAIAVVAGAVAWYFRDFLIGLLHKEAAAAPQESMEGGMGADRAINQPDPNVGPAMNTSKPSDTWREIQKSEYVPEDLLPKFEDDVPLGPAT